MSALPVRRRLVLHVGGYDPLSPAASHARFTREARRFASAWGVRAEVSGLGIEPDLATWTMRAEGPDWAVLSEIELLRWDDVIEAAGRRPAWLRLALGCRAFADYVTGGALWGYIRLAWRYALFFLYPFVLIAGLAAVASLAGWGSARLTGWTTAGTLAGAGAFAGLLAWAGHRLSLSHLLDDWIFARDHLYGDDPVLGPRLERAAARIVAAWRESRADEIVILGHSLGAVLAIDLLDRALAQEPGLGRAPGLGRTGPPLALVTVGSSIPKIGLNRRARRLKAALGRVADAPGIFWVEYQALIDAMNFYRLDPVKTLLGRDAGGPIIRIVRISRMLGRDYYKRIKLNFFRIHNQFVSGNDVRAAYDYFMICAGPMPVEAQARSPLGAEHGIAADGSLLPDAWSGPAAPPALDALPGQAGSAAPGPEGTP